MDLNIKKNRALLLYPFITLWAIGTFISYACILSDFTFTVPDYVIDIWIASTIILITNVLRISYNDKKVHNGSR